MMHLSPKPYRISNHCAICQRPCLGVLCIECETKWDAHAAWVQQLICNEHHWRQILQADMTEIALHICVDGHLHHLKAIHLRDIIDDDDVMILVRQLLLWGSMGGLSVSEQHAFSLLVAGIPGSEAARILGEDEHHDMTASGYYRRVEHIFKKIHQALLAGEIDLDKH